MKLSYDAGGYSEIGNVRRLNEDCIGMVDLPEEGFALFILCDGMGGHKRGDLASRLALRYTSRTLQEELRYAHDPRSYRALLYRALTETNHKLYRFAQRSERFTGMGTTIVVALLHVEGLLVYGHVGDSRLYLRSEKGLERLTKDHSVAQAFMDQGLLTEEELPYFPRRNEITQCIGMGPDMQPSLGLRQLRADDRLLLSSDGLHGVVRDEEMRDLLDGERDPRRASEALIALALDHRTRDNVSAIVVNYQGNGTEILGDSDIIATNSNDDRWPFDDARWP